MIKALFLVAHFLVGPEVHGGTGHPIGDLLPKRCGISDSPSFHGVFGNDLRPKRRRSLSEKTELCFEDFIEKSLISHRAHNDDRHVFLIAPAITLASASRSASHVLMLAIEGHLAPLTAAISSRKNFNFSIGCPSGPRF